MKTIRFTKTKRISIIILLLISTTGCQSKGLLSYQEALETTQGIQKGEIKIEADAELNFDKTGLSFEAEKELSNFEKMSGIVTTKYDINKELMEANIYYIQGGVGLDFSLFLKDKQLVLQLPIINLFMILEENIMEIDNDNDEINSDSLAIDLDLVMKEWISVFNEEDVVVGKNTYILTNEGQLKTTKYTFNLDQDQLETLENQLLSQIDINLLNQLVINQVQKMNSEEDEITFDLKEILDQINFMSIEGQAYVDFDQRLIRQDFILKGQGLEVKPGDLESFEINLSITYLNLGEEQNFEFPTLTEENIVDQDRLEKLLDIFSN